MTQHHSDQVSIIDTDVLMRRCLPMKLIYNSKKLPPLQTKAFLPREADRDGLSFSRMCRDGQADFLTPEQLQQACTHPEEKLRLGCGVCSIIASETELIGLRIQPDRQDHDPGHVLLPDINFPDFEGDRATTLSTQQILCWVAELTAIATIDIPPQKL